MPENLSPNTLADASVNSAADGGGTVESSAVSLAELSKALGTDFKDSATALKAIQDTKAYVGKRREDIAAEVKTSLQQPSVNLESKVQSLENQLFFTANPQYKGLEPVISMMGNNPSEVVNRPEFKTVYEKVVKADEIEQSKSIVSSNSRLSQPAEPVVAQAVHVANARGTTQEDVAMVFAEAINQQNRE